MTLTDFLLARIVEDEEAARDPQWLALEYGVDSAGRRAFSERGLAECDAKRKIVAHHAPYPDDHEPDSHCAGCSDILPCPTLRFIGAVYADHSDFDESWRP